MKIGIMGMPLVGKTTLFNLLTGQHKETSAYSSKGTKNIGIATVYDQRIDYLSSLYHPKKTTYATIEFVDIVGISPGLPAKEKADLFSALQDSEALLFVIRLFEDPVVAGGENPIVQIENLKCELLLRDLEVVENRLERLKNSKKKLTHEELMEIDILEKCYQKLSDDSFLSDLDLSEGELKKLSGFSFYTLKPIIVVLNLSEEQFRSKLYPQKEKLAQIIQEYKMASLDICGKMEMEISELEPEERQLFLEDLKLKKEIEYLTIKQNEMGRVTEKARGRGMSKKIKLIRKMRSDKY